MASIAATTVRPARRIKGTVGLAGDKSISHRYALLAALAAGRSTITQYSQGADCAATLDCLASAGVDIRRTRAADGGLTVDIEGRGLGGLRASPSPLDARNSGTTMRLLSGVLAAHPFVSVLMGDASLTRRPMGRVIVPLTLMGARIESHDGRPPLTIHGGPLKGIQYRTEVPSAQVKSAVLLAGLQAEGETTVLEPVATRDHTERAFHEFGVRVQKNGEAISVAGGQRLSARELSVPGDVSSATFWMALAAGTPGADIEIEGVGLNPTRTAMIEIARRAGARIEVRLDNEDGGEPVGRIRVSYGSPASFAIEPHEVPGVIDEIPGLAALGALLPEGGAMHVHGAAELRVKESDRISCLATGFRAMGAEVEEFPDGFRLVSRRLRGGTVDAAGDHRLAMAFAIAATGAGQPTTILGASSVDVSYPGFFEALERLTR